LNGKFYIVFRWIVFWEDELKYFLSLGDIRWLARSRPLSVLKILRELGDCYTAEIARECGGDLGDVNLVVLRLERLGLVWRKREKRRILSGIYREVNVWCLTEWGRKVLDIFDLLLD